MVANKKKLIGKMAEEEYTKQKLAKALGMSAPTLRAKIESPDAEFSISESLSAKDILHLTDEEYLEIFINYN